MDVVVLKNVLKPLIVHVMCIYVPNWTCTEIVCPLYGMTLVPNWIYPGSDRVTENGPVNTSGLNVKKLANLLNLGLSCDE